MPTKIQQITTKGIVIRDDRILLVKDHKGVWELPGGRIDFGENPTFALKREFEEELGWTNLEIKNIVDAWSFVSDKRDKHFIVLVFECFSNEKDIKSNEEYEEYKWIPIAKINNLNMREGYKKSINKLNLTLCGKIRKIDDSV